MTSKIWNVVKDRLPDLGVAIISTLVTYAFQRWDDLISSAVHTFWWYYGLPGATLYLAFRLYRLGSGLYQRFTSLEAQVLEDRSNFKATLEAQAKSYQARLEEVMKYAREEIAKRGRELDRQANNRFENLAEVVREDIKERAKLESKVIELENALVPEKKRNAAITLIAKALTDQQVTPSLADMTSARLQAAGAPIPKQYNSLAEMLGIPGTTGKPPTL